MFWRDDAAVADPPVLDTVGDLEIDGCFTLPDATLDDIGDTPVGGPEDLLRPEDFPTPEA